MTVTLDEQRMYFLVSSCSQMQAHEEMKGRRVKGG